MRRGVPAAIITTGLWIVGAIGGGLTIASLINDPSPDNFGYAAGGLVGGILVGGASGRALATKLSPPENAPLPGWAGWNPKNDWGSVWRSGGPTGPKNVFLLLNPKNWGTAMPTGPNFLSGAGTVAGAGAGGGDGTQLIWNATNLVTFS